MGIVIRKARVLLKLALVLASLPLLAFAQQPLTSLRSIHALTNAQASHQLPVSFEATVTYYRDYERPFEPNTPTGDNLLSLPRYKHADL